MDRLPFLIGMMLRDNDDDQWVVTDNHYTLVRTGTSWDAETVEAEWGPLVVDAEDSGTQARILDLLRAHRNEPTAYVIPPGALPGYSYVPSASILPPQVAFSAETHGALLLKVWGATS